MAIPESTGDGWVVDADQKRKDVKAYQDAIARNENDDDVIPFYVKAVKAWPYPYDPSKSESYDELTFSQIAEVAIRVNAAFQALFDGIIKRSGVPNDVVRGTDAK